MQFYGLQQWKCQNVYFFIISQIFMLQVSQYIMSVVAAVGSSTVMKAERNAFGLPAGIWFVFPKC